MLAVIEGADAAPTTQALAEVAAIQRTLQTQLTRWHEHNTQAHQANLPPIRLE